VAHPAKVPSPELRRRSTGGAAQANPLVGRELDHRIANSLQLATDFLLFEQIRVADPTARAALTEAAGRLCAVGQMHRFLSAHGETDAVALKPFLENLAGFMSGSTGLNCTVDADALTLSGAEAQQLALVINELAINTAKHAYPRGASGPFHIVARKDGRTLHLTVSDAGRGLGPAATARPSGLGMSIIQAIVRQLHSTLHSRDDHGAVFEFSVPLASRSAALGSRSRQKISSLRSRSQVRQAGGRKPLQTDCLIHPDKSLSRRRRGSE
jgi:two-component sensor histidine kinase